MNFVVGVVILGITDPHGWGFSADVSKQESIVQRTMTWVWSVDDTQTVAVAGGAADVRAGGELHPAAGDEGAVERGHPGAEAVHLHPAAVHGVVPRPRPHAESCVRAW